MSMLTISAATQKAVRELEAKRLACLVPASFSHLMYWGTRVEVMQLENSSTGR